MHDFPDEELGKVTPYGIYDLTRNTGFVNVGTDHDTGAFAVASIRGWWQAEGKRLYPQAPRLVDHRRRRGEQWVSVAFLEAGAASWPTQRGSLFWSCHFPPGTSKWNKVEHRLFSFISTNWRGLLLVSHEVIIETISAVTTRTGLTVTAVLDTGIYPKGIRIPDKDMKAFEARHLQRHQFHGNWNYTIPADPPGDTTRPNTGARAV